MSAPAQTYESHRRWLAPWHFFVMPILAANVVVVAKRALAGPTFATGWDVVVAITLLVGMIMARYMSLINQNRIIRAEERARLARLAPADARDGEGLRLGQYIALRFAPDEEVPDLVRRIRSGELKQSSDIKRAIRNWRADTVRV